ncbi:MAG TPA: NADP-dependent malic enzyme, partial [Alphaproteobacteria bacterium]|nr:NADP-dependent malic enzyme [Alphaproteobacteria bacterium]
IKAPECFEVERKLKERMNIPVFHDDQHGTAIIAGAAIYNWLRLVNRKIETIRLVCSGAGAAALACLDVLVGMGMKKENIIICDRTGVVYKGRNEFMDVHKERYANDTKARNLLEALKGADIFLGLSGPNIMGADHLKQMAKAPLILAMANPTPEVDPALVAEVRPDAILGTGRSDYPNQVNNVLCFPFIFRGALDVGATTINEEMKIACVRAIADLATEDVSETVASAYIGEDLKFGPKYIIPKPFDPRLIIRIAPAVAEAAMKSGVATRPISDMEAYREMLSQFVYRSGFVMRNIFIRAKEEPKRIVMAEGEDERVLRAVQAMVDEGIAKPIVIGRPEVVERRLKNAVLRITPGKDFEIVNPNSDERYSDYWHHYHNLMERRGVSPDDAKLAMRTDNTVIASMMVTRGDADGMICGMQGSYHSHLCTINNVFGLRTGLQSAAAYNLLVLQNGTFLIGDTQIQAEPTARQVADTTLMGAELIEHFGLEPKIALCSHSNFGTHNDAIACKMRDALAEVRMLAPDLEIEGEMHVDMALDEAARLKYFPLSRLKGQANVLIMPGLSSASISMNMLRFLGEGVMVGPILMGINAPANILTPATTVRGILNMAALTALQAQMNGKGTNPATALRAVKSMVA